MLKVNIPGYGQYAFRQVVFDYNGTLATDGLIPPKVAAKLNELASRLQLYIMTADTFGTVREACKNIKAEIKVLTGEPGGPEKEAFVNALGSESTIAFGNGANDALMLRKAGLGVLVLGREGVSREALVNADIIVADIVDGLDLLLKPQRLVATLRR
ncbi:MAG: ATPase P [Peptococcaceae bacterium]|nr:ATPase P [Peptococcaceae bacterium]